MLYSILLLALPVQMSAASPADTVAKLRGEARGAEARYERLARRLAPFAWGGFDGSNCDEIVGRFCLRFDSTTVPPSASEAGVVVDSRRDAVEAARRFFAVAPGDLRAAGPLVRLLVQDDRSREAVAAARTFAVLTPDSMWSELLLGLAHHAAGAADEAERRFVSAIGRMDAREQRIWTDPEWLLEQSERRALRRLSADARREYERRFWIASDPFWLTPANERWVEHMARHAESRLLARVPVVAGMVSWGKDLDELTVRYGTPTARGRLGRGLDDNSMVEYFDTAQRAYAPERLLTAGFPAPPFPGDPPLLYASRARSGYAVRTYPRVLELAHQLTRFVDGDSVVLRVDSRLATPPDSVPRRGRLTAGLFAYDSAFTRRYSTRLDVAWSADSTRLELLLPVEPGSVIYGVEALDSAAGFAARARFAVDAFIPTQGPIVSDLLINEPFPPGRLPESRDDALLRPLGSLIVRAGDTLGIYAEAYRVGRAGARIEVGLEPASGPSALGRLARWIGRSLGVVGPPTDPRVAWRAGAMTGVHPLALNLPLERDRRGRFVLVLRITDEVSGHVAETRRELLIR